MDLLVDFKFLGGRDQFLQVFNPCRSLLTLFFPVMVDQSAAFNHKVHGFTQLQLLYPPVHFIYQLKKAFQGVQCAGR